MKLHISLTFICDVQVRFEQNAQVLDQFSFTATLGALSVGLIVEPAMLWWLLLGGFRGPFSGMDRRNEAIALLDEAEQVIERTNHQPHQAEVHRVRGVLLSWGQHPNIDASEAALLKP